MLERDLLVVPPYSPLGPDGGYDRRAIMREAHLRTELIRDLHPWQRYPDTFRRQLRDAWAEAQEAAGDPPIPEFLLDLLEEAEAERDRAGDFNRRGGTTQ